MESRKTLGLDRARPARQARQTDRIALALATHDLRRSFVSELLEVGADLSVVQQLTGHASVATTTRYDWCGDKAKRRAVALLHVPFTR